MDPKTEIQRRVPPWSDLNIARMKAVKDLPLSAWRRNAKMPEQFWAAIGGDKITVGPNYVWWNCAVIAPVKQCHDLHVRLTRFGS